MKWSEYLGDEVTFGEEGSPRVLLVAHHGECFQHEQLTLTPVLIEDAYANSNIGLHLIVSCRGVELSAETVWRLGLLGDPNEETNNRMLQGVLDRLIPEAVFQAHINLAGMITQTEARLKQLREVRATLEAIRLDYEGSSINLSLNLAHQVLLIKARVEDKMAVVYPMRLEHERPDVAIVYNNQNRVIGRIGFNPTIEENKNTKGRFGCYPLD